MNLETKRLILREWESKDINDLIEGINNLEVSKWLAMVPYPYNESHALNWIDHCKSIQDDDSNYEFAIILKETGKAIGGTSLININKLVGTAGGGIWINAHFHGCGYGKEAFGKRIEFAFGELNLECLKSGYFEGNEGSFHMQEKLGYTKEDLDKRSTLCISEGIYKNEIRTVLLKENWKLL